MTAIGISRAKYKNSEYLTSQTYKPEETKLYHYTSLEAFISMLSAYNDHKYIEFWPSHLLYSNDSEEYNNGLSLIEKQFISSSTKFPSHVTEKFLKLLQLETAVEKEAYILCLSSIGDSLTQWKYYGNESGIAIQFNLNRNEVGFSGLSKDDDKNYSRPSNYPVGPYKVLYDAIEKESLITNIIKNVYDAHKNINNPIEKERLWIKDLKHLINLCPLLKNHFFEDEKEFRLIFRPCYQDNEEEEIPKLVYYRYKNGRNVPHMKIRLHTN